MTTKKILKIIGYCFLSISIVIVLLIVGFLTPISPLCHSLNSNVYISVGNPVFSQDSKSITFYRQIKFSRGAVGWCAFPAGGKALITENFQVYSVPVGENQQPKLVSTEESSSKTIEDIKNNTEKNLIMPTDKTKWVFYDDCEHSIKIAKNYDHRILNKYIRYGLVNSFCTRDLNSVSDVVMTVVDKSTMESLQPQTKY